MAHMPAPAAASNHGETVRAIRETSTAATGTISGPGATARPLRITE